MRPTLDSYLGIHTQALALEARRTEVLAANLANVDTPNYKARDLDFKAAMAAANAQDAQHAPDALRLTGEPPGQLEQTAPADQVGQGGGGATLPLASTQSADEFLKYRVPLAPALDGNTVDEQLEESAFAANNVRYQATLTFLNVKLHDLLTAIGSQ